MSSLLVRCAVLGAAAMMLVPAFAQEPTEAQRDAIRSSCRSDYEAHCASVPPGGAASLQCLQKNMSSLSSSCQRAVEAIEPPKAASAPAEHAPVAAPAAPAKAAEPAAPAKAAPVAPAPAAPAKAAAPAATKQAATPPAKAPTAAQQTAIRNACRADYERDCASVPPGGAASLACLEQNKSKLSASCAQAVNAVSGGAPAPAAASAKSAPAAGAVTAAAAAPAAPLRLRQLLPREELYVLRSACSADVRTLCGGVAPGGGRIMQCLAVRSASLSGACTDVLAQFAMP